MIFFDYETCGFHGLPVLLQWAEDAGEINLCDIWLQPAKDTLELLEWIAKQDICGFNLTFDWFHHQKIYSVLSIFSEKYGSNSLPVDYIDEIAEIEKDARKYKDVIKPKRAMDLMLHARKGPYQSLMSRHDIKIRKVPTQLAYALARELEKRIEIDGIYFSRRKDKYAPNWKVYDIEGTLDFKDVVLKFSASGSLKVLAEHALGVKPDKILQFADIEIDKMYLPYENGWSPYALSLSSKEKGWKVKVKKGGKRVTRYVWPRFIKQHIDHWAYNKLARKYGVNDVVYTRDLWDYFGKPEPGDDDSELACMVGCVRWKGFSINADKIKSERTQALKEVSGCATSPSGAKKYLAEVMDETEKSQLKSTAKVVLEKMTNMQCDCQLTNEELIPGLSFDFGNLKREEETCSLCEGTGKHPAALRAKEILDARKAGKRVELFDKLLQADRFHASFKVIGTLSSRMSGTDGLNPQGINRRNEVRQCFNLADPGFVLCGGDFDSFEVVLADAVYNDENLRRDLTELRPCQKCDQTGLIPCSDCKDGKCDGSNCVDGKVTCDECDGKLECTYKIHGLFGVEVSGLSYGDVVKSKGSEKDWYNIGKSGVFAMIYGGDWNTLVKKQGISPERAQKAEEGFIRRYPGIAKAREKIFGAFCSMRQPNGIGTNVVWHEPEESIESLTGFKRYFTLENKICRALFDLANQPPKAWRRVRTKVRRRDRDQFVGGAVQSALFGAAFSIQSANMRAAANHVIQSSGATITKRVQRNIWDLQPSGVHEWLVQPLNIHDEIGCPTHPDMVETVEKVVIDTVESYREQVPLINIGWCNGAETWADMK